MNKNMKKIAMVLDSLETGGAQTMVSRLVSCIDCSKYETKVFVLRNKKKSKIEKEFMDSGVNYTYINIGEDVSIVKKVKAYRMFSKEMKAYKPDVIHAHLDFLYSPLYCMTSQSKLIVTIHGWPERIFKNVYKRIMNFYILKKKMILVGCAKTVEKNIQEILPKVTTTYIYNPINLENYYINKCSKDSIFTYIHVARLSPIKNQNLLIDAFYEVLSICPDSKLIIVGDGEMKTDIVKKVNEMGIENKVEFLGERYDIPELLSMADVFVLSSNSECCPMSILEAMASGLPIIATAVGGVREIVGNAGICVEENNIKDMSEAMIKIQRDNLLKRECEKNALKKIKAFDSALIVKKYEELYERI